MEKGVEFALIEIDLEHKPEWFSEVSPYEKVPVIKNGEDRVWESAIINEYLNEVFPDPPLLPQDPGDRALARIWIDFANTKFVNAFYKMLLNQDPDVQKKWKQKFLAHLQFMEREGIGKLGNSGPYWLGDTISLVDVTFYPWFERWCVLEHYRNLNLPSQCNRLQRWWESMSQRNSVQKISNPTNFYIAEYEQYAQNTATGITAQEMREA